MRLEHGDVALKGDEGAAPATGAGPGRVHRIALQRVTSANEPVGFPEPPLALLGAATGIREHRGLWRGAPPQLQLADDALASPRPDDATAQTLAFDPGAVVLGAESIAGPGSRAEGRRPTETGPWLDRLSDVGRRVGGSGQTRPARIVWIDEVPEAAAALLRDGAADVVVRGEADEILPALVQGVLRGRSDWRGERGVSWLEDGEVRHERQGATPMRLATPAWDLVDLECYSQKLAKGGFASRLINRLPSNLQQRLRGSGVRGREATIYTTRSCSADCPTCHGSFGSHGRERPVGEVIYEIRELVQKHRIRHLRIGDAAFDGNPARAEAIAAAIAKLRSAPGFGYLSLSFPRGLRGDGLTPGLIDALTRAGATSLPLRVTTASPRLQRLLKENIDLGRVKTALAQIAERGARGHLLMRLGLPTETVGEVAHTIRWAKVSAATTADFESGRNVNLGPAWTQDRAGDIDDFPSLRRRALTSFYSSPSRASRLAKSFPTSLAQALQRRF